MEQLVERLGATDWAQAPLTAPLVKRSSVGEEGRSGLSRVAKRSAAPAHRRPYGPQHSAEQAYSQARSLLGAGVGAAEVARNLELGIAEVEALRRVLKHENRAAHR